VRYFGTYSLKKIHHGGCVRPRFLPLESIRALLVVDS
ncbi:unnamed protein product, partial [Amoebophrya sp. A120]